MAACHCKTFKLPFLNLPSGLDERNIAEIVTSVILRAALCAKPWPKWILLAALDLLHGRTPAKLEVQTFSLLTGIYTDAINEASSQNNTGFNSNSFLPQRNFDSAVQFSSLPNGTLPNTTQLTEVGSQNLSSVDVLKKTNFDGLSIKVTNNSKIECVDSAPLANDALQEKNSNSNININNVQNESVVFQHSKTESFPSETSIDLTHKKFNFIEGPLQVSTPKRSLHYLRFFESMNYDTNNRIMRIHTLHDSFPENGKNVESCSKESVDNITVTVENKSVLTEGVSNANLPFAKNLENKVTNLNPDIEKVLSNASEAKNDSNLPALEALLDGFDESDDDDENEDLMTLKLSSSDTNNDSKSSRDQFITNTSVVRCDDSTNSLIKMDLVGMVNLALTSDCQNNFNSINVCTGKLDCSKTNANLVKGNFLLKTADELDVKSKHISSTNALAIKNEYYKCSSVYDAKHMKVDDPPTNLATNEIDLIVHCNNNLATAENEINAGLVRPVNNKNKRSFYSHKKSCHGLNKDFAAVNANVTNLGGEMFVSEDNAILDTSSLGVMCGTNLISAGISTDMCDIRKKINIQNETKSIGVQNSLHGDDVCVMTDICDLRRHMNMRSKAKSCGIQTSFSSHKIMTDVGTTTEICGQSIDLYLKSGSKNYDIEACLPSCQAVKSLSSLTDCSDTRSDRVQSDIQRCETQAVPAILKISVGVQVNLKRKSTRWKLTRLTGVSTPPKRTQCSDSTELIFHNHTKLVNLDNLPLLIPLSPVKGNSSILVDPRRKPV